MQTYVYSVSIASRIIGEQLGVHVRATEAFGLANFAGWRPAFSGHGSLLYVCVCVCVCVFSSCFSGGGQDTLLTEWCLLLAGLGD